MYFYYNNNKKSEVPNMFKEVKLNLKVNNKKEHLKTPTNVQT